MRRQEELAIAGPVAGTVVRANLFHEFAAQVVSLSRRGDVATVPPLLVQRAAGAGVGDALARAALARDLHDVVAQSASRVPTPGLARLGGLAGTAAAAGLAVRVEENGHRVRLPADIDLAAYRIVQEALTNSARHSGGMNATIRIAYREGALVVNVDDGGALRLPGGDR